MKRAAADDKIGELPFLSNETNRYNERRRFNSFKARRYPKLQLWKNCHTEHFERDSQVFA